ncbi:MAG TPA: TetR/AcrR family transcriptional regulator [Actinomycetota bacterium]|nr:TetR/AcrR family transcriptional regulator [Actinomycetota bacterium]
MNARVVATRGEAWKSDRRARLLDAADRAIRRLGPRASMDDIAAEAGVTKVVLYRYFGDKGSLFASLAQRYLDELLPELRAALTAGGDPLERLHRTIEAYVAFIDTHREAYDFLMRRAVREEGSAQEAITDFMRAVADEVADVMAAEMDALGMAPIPAEPWAHGLVGMVQMATDRWLHQPDVDRETLVTLLVALLWRGFGGLRESSL